MGLRGQGAIQRILQVLQACAVKQRNFLSSSCMKRPLLCCPVGAALILMKSHFEVQLCGKSH